MKERIKFLLCTLLLFGLVQGLGLGIAFKFKELNIAWPEITWWWVLVFFFSATFVVYIGVRKLRASYLQTSWLEITLKFISVIMILYASHLTFGFFFPESIVLFFSAILVSAFLFIPRVWISDLVMILSLATFGAFLGFCFSTWGIVIILAVISVYDLIAVYKTRHMVVLAEAMVNSQIIFGLIIPKIRPSDFKASLEEVKTDLLGSLSGKIKAMRFSVLGAGDLLFPLLLIVSVFNHYGVFSALVVAGFALLGCLTTNLIFLRLKERPMPALPPIAFLTIIGFLVIYGGLT